MIVFLERMASKRSSGRKRRSCCCHGVCIGFLRPEAQCQQTDIAHEIRNELKKKCIVERDFIILIAENSLICKADGGIEVHGDSGLERGDGLLS